LDTRTTRQDTAIAAVQKRATRGNRHHADGATKPSTHANSHKAAARNVLTGDDVTSSNASSSGSNGSSGEANSGSSGDGDIRQTAADNDFSDAEVNLQQQKQDTHLASIIDYLQNGNSPDDTKIARRLLLTKDNFVIWNDRLLHIGLKRRKKTMPRTTQ